MGKARIDSHAGNGLYNVTIIRDVTKGRQMLRELLAQQAAIENTIYSSGGLVDQTDAAEDAFALADQEFDVALNTWAACLRSGCPNEAQLKGAMIEARKKRVRKLGELQGLRTTRTLLDAQVLEIIKQIGRVQSSVTDREFETAQAWCVDSPHDSQPPLAPNTVVGTLEVYGLYGHTSGDTYGPRPWRNISPSWAGEALYRADRDGRCIPQLAQGTATGLMNIFQLDYVASTGQRHVVGIAQSVNEGANTMTVMVPGITANSSRVPSGYEDAMPRIYENVPVKYQNCNAAAFVAGDRVIVEFTSPKMTAPRVIGFEKNPKQCPGFTGWSVANGRWRRIPPGLGWTWTSSTGETGNIVWWNHDDLDNRISLSYTGPLVRHWGEYRKSNQVRTSFNTLHTFPSDVHGAGAKLEGGVWVIYALCREPDGGAETMHKTRIDGVGGIQTVWTGPGIPALADGRSATSTIGPSVIFNKSCTAAIGLISATNNPFDYSTVKAGWHPNLATYDVMSGRTGLPEMDQRNTVHTGSGSSALVDTENGFKIIAAEYDGDDLVELRAYYNTSKTRTAFTTDPENGSSEITAAWSFEGRLSFYVNGTEEAVIWSYNDSGVLSNKDGSGNGNLIINWATAICGVHFVNVRARVVRFSSYKKRVTDTGQGTGLVTTMYQGAVGNFIRGTYTEDDAALTVQRPAENGYFSLTSGVPGHLFIGLLVDQYSGAYDYDLTRVDINGPVYVGPRQYCMAENVNDYVMAYRAAHWLWVSGQNDILLYLKSNGSGGYDNRVISRSFSRSEFEQQSGVTPDGISLLYPNPSGVDLTGDGREIFRWGAVLN